MGYRGGHGLGHGLTQVVSTPSLEWNFLFSCLNAFNFGPDCKRWIKRFDKNVQSCVINNGSSSDFFNLTRCVRQGNPLSPYFSSWAFCPKIFKTRGKGGLQPARIPWLWPNTPTASKLLELTAKTNNGYLMGYQVRDSHCLTAWFFWTHSPKLS